MPLLVTIREAPRVRTAKAQVCVAICRLPGQIAPFLSAAPSLPPQFPHAPRSRNVSPGWYSQMARSKESRYPLVQICHTSPRIIRNQRSSLF